MIVRITPPEEIIEATIKLPVSKSVAARALVIGAMTPDTQIADADWLPACDDIKVLAAALAQGSGELHLGASASALRFLTAMYASQPGAEVVLTGDESLRRRPVGPLVDTLRRLGADIAYEEADGFAPLRIKGTTLAGGTFEAPAGISSQYVSALMMAAPRFSSPLHMTFADTPPSMPYISLTAAMMRERGIAVELDRDGVTVPVGRYCTFDAAPALDWSAAAFWYELAAISAGWITLEGLFADPLQADSAIEAIGPRVGVLTEFTDEGAELSASPDLFGRLDLDLRQSPDLVPALAVTACGVQMPFRFTGVEALRVKECDRLNAIATELGKLGFVLDTDTPGVIAWEGGRRPVTELPIISAHADHRIAMAMAPLAVFVPGLLIDGAECVAKSYPEFWDHMRAAGFTIDEVTIAADQ